MDCVFRITPLANGKFLHKCKRVTCTNQMTLPTDQPIARNCKGMPESRRAFNFSVATIKHIMRGAPTCTQEQIDARLVICRGCELYNKVSPEIGYCTHKGCGCSITNMKGFVSKLAWADQECPLRKWGRVSPQSAEPLEPPTAE